jgi:hypothetical protein
LAINFLLQIAFDGFKCIEMDEKLMGMWKILPRHRRLASTLLMSRMIQQRASQMISTNVEYSDAAVSALLVCACSYSTIMQPT